MRIESLHRSNRGLLQAEHLFLLIAALLFIQSTNLYAQSVLFVDADAVPTINFALIPVGADGVHEINGNEIILRESGGG